MPQRIAYAIFCKSFSPPISSNANTCGAIVRIACMLAASFSYPEYTSVCMPTSFCGTPKFTAATSYRSSKSAIPRQLARFESKRKISRKHVVLPTPGAAKINVCKNLSFSKSHGTTQFAHPFFSCGIRIEKNIGYSIARCVPSAMYCPQTPTRIPPGSVRYPCRNCFAYA